MADAVGMDGIHNVTGTCDLCGCACDPNLQELNALDCTFPNCPSESNVYHQDCLEKYLKSIKLEKNRKTGFKCPRGSGKGTQFSDLCPGRIDKSHPIISRSDASKKRKKAKAPDLPPAPAPKAVPKVILQKEPEPKSKAIITGNKDAAQVSREQLVAAARAARKEIGLPVSSSTKKPAASAPPPPKETKTLEEFLSQKERAKELRDAARAPPAIPVVNAWARPGLAFPQQQPAAPLRTPALQESESMMTQLASQPNPEKVLWPAQPKSSWAAAASPALRPQSNLISPNHHIQQQQQQQQAFMRGFRMPVPQQQQAGLGSQRPLQAQGAQHPWGNLSYESAIKQQLQSAPLSSNSSGVSNTQHHHQAGVQEEQKLTKSQKKNMKRAEKKAAQRKAAEGSDAGSETSALSRVALDESMGLSEADAHVPLRDTQSHCASLLQLHLLHTLLQQLVLMGFEEPGALAAIARYGNNLEAAASWLLESSGHEVPSKAAAASALDVSSELFRLQECQTWLGCSNAALIAALEQCEGSLDAAVQILVESSRLEQAKQTMAPSAASTPNNTSRHGENLRLQQQDQTALSSLDCQTTSALNASSFVGQQEKRHIVNSQSSGVLSHGSGIFGGMFGNQLRDYIGGGQAFTELVNAPKGKSDEDDLPSRSWSTPVNGSSWDVAGVLKSDAIESPGSSQHYGAPTNQPTVMKGSTARPYSPPFLSSLSPQSAKLEEHENPVHQLNMTPADDVEGELHAGLVLGNELLGLVSAEDKAWADLPAFFGDGPVKYDFALEDPADAYSDASTRLDTNPMLIRADTGLGSDNKGEGSFWSIDPGESSRWGLATVSDGQSQNFSDTAMRSMMGGLPHGLDASQPGSRDRLPDDRELESLMATLVCR